MTKRKIMKYTLTCILLVLSLEIGSCFAQGTTKKSENPDPGSENVKKNGKNVTIENNDKSETENKKTNVPLTSTTNATTKDNVTKPLNVGLFQKIKDNKEMLTRTFYVMLGVTSIVVIYFVVRAWRSKRRQNKSRKYGLLASSGADLEMEPLDRDVDDDDEMTMFERQK